MTASRLIMIDLSATELTPDERELLASRRFGGLCVFGHNIVDRIQLGDYLQEVRSLAGDDFIVAIDQEGGGVIRLLDAPYPPSAMALGAADDPELTRALAAATARGLRSTGVNLDFAPVADVNVNAANPVIADRSFGSDPADVARHVRAFVEGMQGEGIAATAKHFPGHGDTDLDSHLALPTLHRTLAELEELELPPFRAAIDAGVAAIMTAHIMFPALDPDLPATLSPVVLKRILREQLGYDGVIISDALDMLAIARHWPPAEANLLAVRAGVDMTCNIGPVSQHFAAADALDRAAEAGEIDAGASLARLDRLSRDFPGRPPAPEAAWAPGDEELLARAAASALVTTGPLPRLEPEVPVTLVTSEGVWVNSAQQQRVSPGEDLAQELERAGVPVRLLRYRAEQLDEAGYADGLLAALGADGPVLFVSTRRTPLEDAEVELARRVKERAAGQPYVHIALWNPYHALRLPGPALLSFGFRPASLSAVAWALLGAPVTGRLPISG